MSEMQMNPPPMSPPPMSPPMPGDINDNDKLMALLSYLITPIVPIIVLVSESMKARPYQKYHAMQALGLFVAELLGSIVLCVLISICAVITLGIGSVLYCLYFLVFIPQIYYAIIAYSQPRYFAIPILTDFMKKQGWLTVPGSMPSSPPPPEATPPPQPPPPSDDMPSGS